MICPCPLVLMQMLRVLDAAVETTSCLGSVLDDIENGCPALALPPTDQDPATTDVEPSGPAHGSTAAAVASLAGPLPPRSFDGWAPASRTRSSIVHEAERKEWGPLYAKVRPSSKGASSPLTVCPMVWVSVYRQGEPIHDRTRPNGSAAKSMACFCELFRFSLSLSLVL